MNTIPHPAERSLSLDKILTKRQCDQVCKICGSSKTFREAVDRLKVYYATIQSRLTKKDIDGNYLAYVTAMAWVEVGEQMMNVKNN